MCDSSRLYNSTEASVVIFTTTTQIEVNESTKTALIEYLLLRFKNNLLYACS